jgi:hypothetical protein
MDYHQKLAEKVLSPFFSWMPTALCHALCYVWCYIGCAYFSIGFTLLSFEKFHHVYVQMYYYFHVLLIVSLVLFLAIKPKRKSKRD